MRKSVFPRTRICTVLSEFPHVEIHKSMCKSAPRKYAFPHVEIHMRSCISACGNTPKIVNFPTCGNTHFLVYFHMRKFERESEFPHVSLQADLWISAGKNVREYTFFADFCMRKYTRICEFPRAEIHAERCITACGNTLNQVQKNSLFIFALSVGCCSSRGQIPSHQSPRGYPSKCQLNLRKTWNTTPICRQSGLDSRLVQQSTHNCFRSWISPHRKTTQWHR